jgi:hypothetical protein
LFFILCEKSWGLDQRWGNLWLLVSVIFFSAVRLCHSGIAFSFWSLCISSFKVIIAMRQHQEAEIFTNQCMTWKWAEFRKCTDFAPVVWLVGGSGGHSLNFPSPFSHTELFQSISDHTHSFSVLIRTRKTCPPWVSVSKSRWLPNELVVMVPQLLCWSPYCDGAERTQRGLTFCSWKWMC